MNFLLIASLTPSIYKTHSKETYDWLLVEMGTTLDSRLPSKVHLMNTSSSFGHLFIYLNIQPFPRHDYS